MSRRHVDYTTVVTAEFQGKEFKFVVDLDTGQYGRDERLKIVLREFFENPPCCVWHRLVGLNDKPCSGINEAWEASMNIQTVIVSEKGSETVQAIDLRKVKL